jgi:hypothetical protein
VEKDIIMTKKLVKILNTLIEEGYVFLTIKEDEDLTKYRLVTEDTSCVVRVMEDDIYVSLCLLDDIDNKSYASERNVTVEYWGDVEDALELIKSFEEE